MKTQYLIIGLILSAFLFLGCTQNQQNNLPTTDKNTIGSEVDAGWINDTTPSTGDMVATDQEMVSSEATTIDETQTISVGEMI